MRILVDVSGLAHACARKYNLSTSKGIGTGVVYGVFRALENLSKVFSPEELVVCFDGGSEARKEIYPEYKDNRDDSDPIREVVSEQLKLLRQILVDTPIHVAYCPGVEADDIIALLCGFLKNERVTIATRDQDLHQLGRTDPELHDFIDFNGSFVTPKMPSKWVVPFKSLEGDSGDNIKGVPGIGPKTAKRLIEDYKSLRGVMRHAKQEGKLGRATYSEALAIVKRNKTLVKLDGSLLTEAQRKQILNAYKDQRRFRGFNLHRFEMSIMELELDSINSRLSEFLSNFSCLFKGYTLDLSDVEDENDLPETDNHSHLLSPILSTGSWLLSVTPQDLKALFKVVRSYKRSSRLTEEDKVVLKAFAAQYGLEHSSWISKE